MGAPDFYQPLTEQRRRARAWDSGRRRTRVGLELAGLRAADAEAWVEAWAVTTEGLDDFRASSEFWQLGFDYAIEEHRRGHQPPRLPGVRQAVS
jgi:hypothetical protein